MLAWLTALLGVLIWLTSIAIGVFGFTCVIVPATWDKTMHPLWPVFRVYGFFLERKWGRSFLFVLGVLLLGSFA